MVLRRLRTVLAMIAALLVISTVGYVVLAGYSLFDATYMSVITVGAVGYEEVQPLDSLGRTWTILVVLAGNGVFLYATSLLVGVFISGEFRSAVRRQREGRRRTKLVDHVVIVGGGRVGRGVAAALAREGRDAVVIDRSPRVREMAESFGMAFLDGDATTDEVLEAAQVRRAHAVITTLDDAANLLVTLAVRALAPGVRVIARMNDRSQTARLRQAGAELALSPYEWFGAELAAAATSSAVVGLQDLPSMGLQTEELEVRPGAWAEGKSLAELSARHPAAIAIGMRRGATEAWQRVEDTLRPGDVVFLLGTPDDLRSMEERFMTG
ncbi:MAG: NAD-binding protein [Microthrixaceae bacterium]